MRKLFRSLDKTLNRFGLRRGKKSKHVRQHKARSLQLEPLERRELLSVAPTIGSMTFLQNWAKPGDAITLTANVTDPDADISSVSLYLDGDMQTPIGTGSLISGTNNWTCTYDTNINIPVGNHIFSTVATDSTNLVSNIFSNKITVIASNEIAIESLDDLQKLSTNIAPFNNWSSTAHYALVDDIDASGTALSSWGDGNGFLPIGTYTNQFSGRFNGYDHVISGLSINRGTTSHIGLFGCASSTANIINLGIENESIVGGWGTGGLIGRNYGDITNCYTTGYVSGTDHAVGGLVGYSSGSVNGINANIDCCYSSATVKGLKDKNGTGGMIGANDRGSVITDSFATGNVSGGYFVGGFIGRNQENSSDAYGPASVDNCFSTGNVTADNSYAGGFVGANQNSGQIIDCFTTSGLVKVAYSDYLGLFAGFNNSAATITNAYYNEEGSLLINNTPANGNTSIASPVNVMELNNPNHNVYNGTTSWTFSGDSPTWVMAGLPHLKQTERRLLEVAPTVGELDVKFDNQSRDWAKKTFPITLTAKNVTDPDGSIDHVAFFADLNNDGRLDSTEKLNVIVTASGNDYIATYTIPDAWTDNYRSFYAVAYDDGIYASNAVSKKLLLIAGNETPIESLDDLQRLSNNISPFNNWSSTANYALVADIDASATATWNNNDGFLPIALGSSFNGEFDGYRHTINGLTINRPSTSNVGLFSQLTSSAQVRNLGLENVNISGLSAVGGLTGGNFQSSISNCYVTGYVSGNRDTNGLSGAGGLVGLNAGNLEKSFSTASVNSNLGAGTGGLAGYNYYAGTIKDSYATGNVSGVWHVGGFVGLNYMTASVDNCYSTGNVTGTSARVGGFIGGNLDSTTVTDCFSTGNVTGYDSSSSRIGAFLGYNDSSATPAPVILNNLYNQYATVKNTYTSNNVNYNDSSAINLQTLRATTFSFYQGTGASPTPWVFTGTWTMAGLPHLSWQDNLPCVFADDEVARAVKDALGLADGKYPSLNQMATLTSLTLDANLVRSLYGLETAINLESLTIIPKDFSQPATLLDLSPIALLPNLKTLSIQHCALTESDLEPLTYLHNLESLDLRYNNLYSVPQSVTDLSCHKLSQLYLYGNATNPNTGLVGHWTFDGTSNDSTNYSHNGALNGYVSPETAYINGKQGLAIHFDGVDDYVTMNNVPVNLTSGGKNTVSFWMKRDSSSTLSMPFSFTNLDLLINGANFGFNTYNNDLYGFPIENVPADKWVNITAVFANNSTMNGTNFKIYVDGIQQSLTHHGNVTTSALRYATSNVYLGKGGSSNHYFKGGLDDLRIFNRELTADEIDALHALGLKEIDLTNLAGKAINTDIPPDHPENAKTVADLAKALHYSPIEMYEWVLNNIEYQPYAGSMKGPQAVFETRAGNDWDTDTLLVQLFGEASVTGMNYATTRIVQAIQPSMEYVGVLTPKALYKVLDKGGMFPKLLDGGYFELDPETQASSAVYAAFTHTWLEASMIIPGQGVQTVVLDPSWKVKDYQTGISGIFSTVPFDETKYLAEPSKELPYEFYENQVRDYLVTHQSDKNIADVSYDGPIHNQIIHSFSTTIPYDNYYSPISRNTSIPTDYQNRLRISVAVPQAGNKVCGTNYNGTTTRLTATTAVFNSSMIGKPLVIEMSSRAKSFVIDSYISSTEVYVKDDATCISLDFSIPGFSVLDQTTVLGMQRITIACTGSGSFTPTLYRNGGSPVASSISLANQAPYYVLVDYLPGLGYSGIEYYSVYKRNIGDYIVLGIDAGQISAQMVADARDVVNAEEIIKINSGTPDRDRLIGGLLYLAGLTYYYETHHAQEVICDLTFAQPLYNMVQTSLLSTPTSDLAQLEYNEKVQLPYMPHSMLLDAKGLWWNAIGINDMTSNDVIRDRMIDYNLSAMESGVWEELVNIPSISTIKALQLAHKNGIQVVTIPDDGSVSSLLGALNQQVRDSIIAYVNNGYKVVVPTQNVCIGNNFNEQWIGVGYILQDYIDGQWWDSKYIIHGGINGTIDDPRGGYAVYPPSQPIITPNSFTQWYVGDPINIANGNVLHDETDFSIPNLGVPLSISRHYDSCNTVPSGQTVWSDRGMGEGWSFSYCDKLIFEGNNVTWFTDTGLKLKFTYQYAADGVKYYTTPESIFGTLTYNIGTGVYTWTDKTGSIIKFDTSGRMTTMADRYGNGVTVSYDANGIDKVTDLLDTTRFLNFSYNSDSPVKHIASITDFTNRTWYYDYNTNRRLYRVRAPYDTNTQEAVVLYSYYDDDANTSTPDGPALAGLLKTVTDPNLGQTTYSYYANRRGFKVTDPEGNEHSLSYNLYRNRTSFTDERGNTTNYSYDTNGNLIQKLNPDRTTTSYTWSNGLKISATDEYGKIEQYQYDENVSPTVWSPAWFSPTTSTLPISFSISSPGSGTYYTGQKITIEWNAANVPFGAVICLCLDADNTWNANEHWIEIDSITGANGHGYFTWDTSIGYSGGSSVTAGFYYVAGYLYCNPSQTLSRLTTQITISNPPTFALSQPDTNTFLLGQDVSLEWISANVSAGTIISLCLDEDANWNGNEHWIEIDQITASNGEHSYIWDTNNGFIGGSSILADIPYYIGGYSYNNVQTLSRISTPIYFKSQRIFSINAPASGSFKADQPLEISWNATGWTGGATANLYYTFNQNNSSVFITTIPITNGKANYIWRTPSNLAFEQHAILAYVYDAKGNLTKLTNRNNKETTYTYTNYSNLMSISIPSDSGTATTTYEYYADGSLKSKLDAESNRTSYTYCKAPIQDTSGKWYTAYGLPKTMTTPKGNAGSVLNTYTYTYNSAGQMTSNVARVDSSTNITESYYYDNRGFLQTTTDGKGFMTSYDYDLLGHLKTTTLPDPDGTNPLPAPITKQDYDALGNLTSVKESYDNAVPADERTSNYSYDKMQRKTVAKNVDCTFSTSQYDAAGNLVYQTDELGHVTQFVYDVRNRLIKTILSDGSVTSTLYDGGGRAIAVTDALGNTTKFTYDVLGRKKSQILPDPDGDGPLTEATTMYYYDAFGNLQYVVDPVGVALGVVPSTSTDKSHITEYKYDKLGRKVAEILPDADGNSATKDRPITIYKYDKNGNLQSVIDTLGASDDTFSGSVETDVLGNDAAHRTEYVCDELNRKIKQILPDPDGGLPISQDHTGHRPVTRYYYDANNNLKYVVNSAAPSTIDPATDILYTTEYQYDALNRKTKEIQPDPDGSGGLGRPTISHEYNKYGDLIKTIDARGSETTFEYDIRHRQNSVTDALTAKTDTWYDSAGNVVAITDALYQTTNFEYNDRNQKIADILPDPDGDGPLSRPTTKYYYNAQGNLQYIVDPVGVAAGIDPTDPTTTDYSHITEYEYDALGRKVKEIQPNPDGGSLAADRPVTQYAYDIKGNLTSVMDPLGRVTIYKYDNLGRKTSTFEGNIIDNGDPGYQALSNPNWSRTQNTDGGYAGNYDLFQRVQSNNGDKAVTYTFDNLDLNKEQEFEFYTYKPVIDAVRILYFDLYNNDGSHSFLGYASVGSNTSVLGDGWQKLTILNSTSGLPAHLSDMRINKIVVSITGELQYSPLIADAIVLVQKTSEITYNTAGQITRVEDACGNITEYTYDNLGQKINQIQYDGKNLIGYWKLDETSGTTTADSSGTGKTGTLINGASFTSTGGQNNGAVTFDGFNDYVGVPDSGDLKYYNVGDEMTLSTWVYIDTLETTGGYLLSKYWNGSRGIRNYYLQLTTNNKITFVVTPWHVGTTSITSTNALLPGCWHYVTATVDSSHRLSLYVDGVTAANSVTQSTTPNVWMYPDGITEIEDQHLNLAIGTIYPYGSGNWDWMSQSTHLANCFQGKIDDVRIYRRALSAEEIAENMLFYTTTYKYDALGNIKEVKDTRGNTTNYVYDNLGRKIKEILPEPTTGAGRPTTYYGYDANGNLKFVTDPRGSGVDATTHRPDINYTTYYFYDELNRLVCTIDPLGRDGYYTVATETTAWTTWNIQDWDWAPEYAAHDHSTRTTYDALGNAVEEFDQLGHSTQYVYDRLNRLVETIGADPDDDSSEPGGVNGPLTSPHSYYQYDLAGNKIAAVDPLGDMVQYQYDSLGRLVKTIDQLGRVSTTTYDAAGNVLTDTDAAGNTTYYAYDAFGRLIDTWEPDTNGFDVKAGPHTQYEYDAAGRRTKLIDPDNNETLWTYGIFGLVLKESIKSGTTQYDRTYGYDAAGNLLWKKDRDNRVIGYTYDTLNRKSWEKWYNNLNDYRTEVNNPEAGTNVYKINYQYDNANNLYCTDEYKPGNTDPVIENFKNYDQLGRVDYFSTYSINDNRRGYYEQGRIFLDNGLLESTYSTISMYDTTNLASWILLFSNSDAQTDYAYDNLDRLTSVTQHSQSGGAPVLGKRVDYTYDAAGQYKTVTRYSSVDGGSANEAYTSNYVYDAAGQLKALIHRDGGATAGSASGYGSGSVVTGYHYVYDNVGRSTLESADHLGSTQNNNYSYDNTDQVLSANYAGATGSASAQLDESFTYDAAGNRLSTNGTSNSHGIFNRLTSDGHYRYDYNNEGDLIRRYVDVGNNGDGATDTDITLYTYDHRNRLTKVEHKPDNQTGTATDKAVAYLYDSFNRRIKRAADVNGAATGGESTEFFFYDGNNVVLDAVDADAGGQAFLPVPAHRYLWGQAVDELLAQENIPATGTADADDLFWTLQDRQQSVGDAINASGTVQIHEDYDAFGNCHQTVTTYAGGSIAETDIPRYKYTCQEIEPLFAGLMFYGGRWYDTSTGKFLSEDPSGFDGGDPNLYCYVGNNPINMTDPTGLCSLWSGTGSMGLNFSYPLDFNSLNESIRSSSLSNNTTNYLYGGGSSSLGYPGSVSLPSIGNLSLGSSIYNSGLSSGINSYSPGLALNGNLGFSGISDYSQSISTPRLAGLTLPAVSNYDPMPIAVNSEPKPYWMDTTSVSPTWAGVKAGGANILQIVPDAANAVTNIPATIDNIAIGIYNNFVAPVGNAILDPIASSIPGQFGGGPAFPQIQPFQHVNWSQSLISQESDAVHQSRVMIADAFLPLAANKVAKLADRILITQLSRVSEVETVGSEIKANWNIWDNWDPKIRGRAIETLWGRNLPKDFPVIDNMDVSTGVASSYKSINLADKTYQKASQLRSVLKGYVNDLAEFNGAKFNGAVVSESQIQQKVLKVAIPPSTRYIPSQAQQQVLKEISNTASKKGIGFIVEEVGG